MPQIAVPNSARYAPSLPISFGKAPQTSRLELATGRRYTLATTGCI